MNALRSPRYKLFIAAGLLAVLALLATIDGIGASQAARALLGVAAVAALGAWWARRRRASDDPMSAPRLQVISRAGLSQRCGLALVEADGRRYLVVFGDGFAELQLAAPSDVKVGAS